MNLPATSLSALFSLRSATKEFAKLPPPEVGRVGRVARQFVALSVEVGKALGRDMPGYHSPETVSSPDEALLHSLPVIGFAAVRGGDYVGIWSRNLFGEKRNTSALPIPS